MSSGNSKLQYSHIVAMPYPGRGHINPLLNLCKHILSRDISNLTITFVVTEEWLGFLSADPEPLPANLRLVAVPQVVPSEIGRAGDFPGFVKATMTKLQDPFEKLLDMLELPATAIIYDTYLGWVVKVGNQRNIPVASFYTMSASMFTIFSHFHLLEQYGQFPLSVSERGHEKVDYIPGLPATTIADMPTLFEGDGRAVVPLVLPSISAVDKAQYVLLTSIHEFESQAIDALKEKLSVPIYHIGPMIPYFKLHRNGICGGAENSKGDQSYFQWLDSQPQGSVLYISQGSFLSVSSAQMDEIVAGVIESGVRFLWVTRSDSSRFRDGPGEMGYLVPWCDQLKVLCHPSVGGFWTHCGWNSTSEGLYAGVPMLTCPIFFDQTLNSKFIVSDLKIGKRVINNSQFVSKQEISELLRAFMDSKSEERIEMVKRANMARQTFTSAITSGGSAASDLDAFIKSIS